MTSSNLLLDLMPAGIGQAILDTAVAFEFDAGELVPQHQLRGNFVWMPTGGVASKFQISASGRTSEIGMVGREGMFPLSGLLQVQSAPHIVLAQIGPFQGCRLRTEDFHRLIEGSEQAQSIVCRYTYAFITQISSNILTSEQTDVAARVARWLLMSHDRIDGDVVAVTHETIAQMTFSHRPTVTNCLHAMREHGLIDLTRGHVTVWSRDGLREIADGAYGLSEQYYRENLGPFGKGPFDDQWTVTASAA